MPDKIDELIKEVAHKHHTIVKRDDPILIMATINDHLAQDSKEAQEVLLRQLREELEEHSYRWSVESKDNAEIIINGALTAAKKTFNKSFEQQLKVVNDVMQQRLQEFQIAHRTIGHMVNICSICCLLSCIALLGAVTLVLM